LRSSEPFDVLVNAAGTDVPSPVASLPVEDWDRVLNVNLRAAFLLAQAAWPHMIARGAGTIINVGSVAGRRGCPKAVAYCAAKFGLTGLTPSPQRRRTRTPHPRLPPLPRRDGH